MSGHWRIDPREIEKHDHFILETDDGHACSRSTTRGGSARSTWCHRRARRVAAVRRARPRAVRPRRRRAQAPRSPGARRRSSCCCSTSASSPGSAISTSARRCSARGIHPRRAAGSVSLDRLERLVPAITAVLDEAIAAGGSTLARLRLARRRARLFLQELRRLRPRRRAVRGLRRHRPAHRPGRPLDLLLPALPALSGS